MKHMQPAPYPHDFGFGSLILLKQPVLGISTSFANITLHRSTLNKCHSIHALRLHQLPFDTQTFILQWAKFMSLKTCLIKMFTGQSEDNVIEWIWQVL